MPAPPDNTNNLRHGLRSKSRFALRLGSLPKQLRRVEHDCNEFRRTLENLVVEAHGEINLVRACAINTSCRWERVARLAHRWLREHHDEMSHADRLSYAKQVASASTERDKAVRLLDLNATPADIWATIHESPSLAKQHDDAKPNDASHAKTQQAVNEPSRGPGEASPPAELASEELGTRFTDPANGFPQTSVSSGKAKVVDCSDDNESTADQNVLAQQAEDQA